MEHGRYEYNLKAIGAKHCLLDWTTDYAGVLLWYGRFKATDKFCYYIVKRPAREQNHVTESEDTSRDDQSDE